MAITGQLLGILMTFALAFLPTFVTASMLFPRRSTRARLVVTAAASLTIAVGVVAFPSGGAPEETGTCYDNRGPYRC